MWVLEHVADGGLALEVVEAEAGRGRELGHVHDLHRELLPRLPVQATTHQRERSLPWKEKIGIVLVYPESVPGDQLELTKICRVLWQVGRSVATYQSEHCLC